MALQGTIDSFPLVDVLQLLTSSSKTGRLDLVGDRGRGALWVADGLLVGGTIQGRAATEPADAVWELLRFADGSFEFRAGEEPREPAFSSSVGETVERATEMLREWEEITEKVPGLGHRVALAEELPGEDVRLRGDDWSVVVAAGPGPRVSELLDRLELAEFGGCRRLSEMVDRGLIEVNPDSAAGAFDEDPSDQHPEPEDLLHQGQPATDQAGEPPQDGADDLGVGPVEVLGATGSGTETTGTDSAGIGPAGTDPAVAETGSDHDGLDDRPLSELYSEPEPAGATEASTTRAEPETQAHPTPREEPVARAETFPQAGPASHAEHTEPAQTEPADRTEPAQTEPAQTEPVADTHSAPAPELDVAVPDPGTEFPDHFPIDDLVDTDEAVGWDTSGGAGSPAVPTESETAAQAPTAAALPESHHRPADSPVVSAADPFGNGNQPVSVAAEGSDDVLAQIGRLSPKAAEAIAAALGDNHEPPQ